MIHIYVWKTYGMTPVERRSQRASLLWVLCHFTGLARLVRGTGWRRHIGSLKPQVIFRQRATNYKALLRKMSGALGVGLLMSIIRCTNASSQPISNTDAFVMGTVPLHRVRSTGLNYKNGKIHRMPSVTGHFPTQSH